MNSLYFLLITNGTNTLFGEFTSFSRIFIYLFPNSGFALYDFCVHTHLTGKEGASECGGEMTQIIFQFGFSDFHRFQLIFRRGLDSLRVYI